MRVRLLRPPRSHAEYNPHSRNIVITESLPYFQCGLGRYVHRVRHAEIHVLSERKPHASFRGWCGVATFIGGESRNHRDGILIDQPGPRDVVCATCEGRAIGSGMVGTPTIDGQPVRFSPRIEGVRYERMARDPDDDWKSFPSLPLDEGPEIDVVIFRRDTGERI